MVNIVFSLQTEEFNEPVTLDFLDAELENEIKVEVWEMTRPPSKTITT